MSDYLNRQAFLRVEAAYLEPPDDEEDEEDEELDEWDVWEDEYREEHRDRGGLE